MLNDPLAGRGPRAPERSRMLVATEDGVFLWPGTALVYRRGNGFFAAEPRDVNSALACFFGPTVTDVPIQNVLERARDELRWGRVEIVQAMLDRLRLPPISQNGDRLRRAIATRQQTSFPDFSVADRQDGSLWTDEDIAFIASLHHGVHARARFLEKVFNPAMGDPGVGWDSAKHPRHPAGESNGGEFAPAGEGDGSIIPVAGPQTPWSRKPQKPIGPPPIVPKTEPITKAAKYLAIRTVGYWLIRAVAAGSDIVAPEIVGPVMAAVEATAWLAPYVKAYFNPPETLEELQDAVNDPPAGTNTHHIVEQKSAEDAGFPRSQIDDPSNLVQIPELKHWELNHWYDQPNTKDYGGLTPRQYIKNKDWDTRRQVGLNGLREVGVLK